MHTSSSSGFFFVRHFSWASHSLFAFNLPRSDHTIAALLLTLTLALKRTSRLAHTHDGFLTLLLLLLSRAQSNKNEAWINNCSPPRLFYTSLRLLDGIYTKHLLTEMRRHPNRSWTYQQFSFLMDAKSDCRDRAITISSVNRVIVFVVWLTIRRKKDNGRRNSRRNILQHKETIGHAE